MKNEHRLSVGCTKLSLMRSVHGSPDEQADRRDFWGCRRFPECRGTRNIGEEFRDSHDRVSLLAPKQTIARRVETVLDSSGIAGLYGLSPADGRHFTSPTHKGNSVHFLGRWLVLVLHATFAAIAALIVGFFGPIALAVVATNPVLLVVTFVVWNQNKRTLGRRRYRRY